MRQEQRTGRPGRIAAARSRFTAATQWRDWNLPVKLGAVMLVPTLLALVLGIVLIQGQVSSADTYTGAEQRTALAGKVRTVAEALQNERAGQANQKVPGNLVGPADLKRIRGKVDTAVTELRRSIESSPELDYAAESGKQEIGRQLGRLPSIRQATRSTLVAPSTVTGYYTDVLDSVIGLERALLSKVADPQLAGQAAAVYDIDAAKEEISFQEATVLVGLTRGRLLRDELEALRGSKTRFDELIDDLRSVGGDQLATAYDQTVSGDRVQQRAMAFRQILDGADGGVGQSPAESVGGALNGSLRDIDPAQWAGASNQTTDRLNELGTEVSDRLSVNASDLRNSASNRAGLTAVLLFVALLAAAAIVVVIARHLLRSMSILRGRARTIAEHELPDAVAQIQAGREVPAEVAPVPVTTREELGQLARAFDDLHTQARRLATEQAALRTSYGNVFVNLSRRSQSLVQRQLRLIERLERDEEDPDQLATLFQLDHLATRMRRNNENLMVLSGSEQGRGTGGQPTGIADLLRAAVSEIEQYQRVEVQPPPGVLIVGYAAGDLVRLVAELLDNATAFSAPETQVSVATRAGSDGTVAIDVIDQGVGMRNEDMTAANERLSSPDNDAVPAARRMGLFVVSRLGGRHGIKVSLHGADDIDGIRACIVIPANLVAATEAPAAPLTMAESTAGRDMRASNGPAVGPTMPAPAAPFGDRQSDRNSDVPDAPPGFGQMRWPSADDRPTEQYPRVPQQERAAASAWASSQNGSNGSSTSDIPASDELFTPLRPNKPKRDPEQTPIFDEMISAWFTAPEPKADKPEPEVAEQEDEFDMFSVAERKQTAAPQDRPEWTFEADKGWQAVEAVSRTTPESFTSVGLPRRTPRARLVPGSVGNEPLSQEPSAARDPESVRNRLSSFQRGVSEGRASGHAAEPEPTKTNGHNGHNGERHERDAADYTHYNGNGSNGSNGNGGTGSNGNGHSTERSAPAPRREPAVERTEHTPTQRDRRENDGKKDADGQPRWDFAADAGWRASAEAAQSDPEPLTNAGLPRRTPRARLVPGSAGDTQSSTVDSPRDAENVRSRLNSFQRGLSDGRHSLAGSAQDTHPHQQEKE